MSIFGKVLKGTFDLVTLPVDVAKDLATGGGLATDQDEPYTVQKARRLCDDAEEFRDELDKL